MIALSTAWNAARYEDGLPIIEEIEKLGIRSVELNFSLTAEMVEDIFRYCRQKGLKITSLHNYCPIPQGLKRSEALPDCFSLSSVNEEERKKAVEFTKITISIAKKLSAYAVVLHVGRVEIEDKTRQLIDLCNSGRKDSAEFKDILADFKQQRELNREAYFAALLKSLESLRAYAQEKDIVLGLENRFYYREIPSLEEFEIIFDTWKDKTIAYWHDVGHAYILERLGFMGEGALLKKYANRLFGTHLHNVKDLVDHQAPIEGEFDFKSLKPFVKAGVLNVIEAHENASPDSIKKSYRYLEGVFND